MHVRRMASCLLLAAVLTACSSTETGTAQPGVVATTTVTSTAPGSTITLPGPTVSGPTVTSAVITSVTTSVTVRSTVVQPTTVVRTVTKTVTGVARPAPPASRTTAPPAQDSGWTHQPNSDGTGTQTFPDSLPGWSMTSNWQSGPKAFSSGFTPATGIGGDAFPSTMSGCDSQRFLVIWHVQNVTVTAAWLDDTGAVKSPVTGSSGWFDLDSCQTPAFQAMAGSGGVADISVDVQQYGPAG